jgi:BirA family biotin operon repressor/biotin-[acetyl-CoA-carboxylase] ligase
VGIEGLNIEEINSKVSQYWSVSFVAETGSTQIDLRENFSARTVLIADYQSAGRGRLDRKFEVPAGKGFTFSFSLNAESDFGWIPLLTGLAVAEGINKYVKRDLVHIKWPNDLLIDTKKLGGILSEQVANEVVVGVGINIYQTKEELPIANATSLAMYSQIDRSDLLVEILNSLGQYLLDSAGNMNELKNLYRKKCQTIGKEVLVTLPGGEVLEDIAIGIAEDGSLLLRNREISVADIVHLR